MEAGGLRHRIRPYYKTYSDTSLSGSQTTSYTQGADTWAQINNRSGQLREEMATRFGDYTLELVVRIYQTIKEEDRVRLLDDNSLYVVVSVIPNRDRQMKTLICMAVKE